MAPNETWRMWRGVSTVRYNFQLVYIFLLKHVETTENSNVSDRPRFGCQKHPGGPCFCCIWSWVCLKMGDALPQKMAGISWWFLLFPFVDQNCYWKLVRFPVSHSIPVVCQLISQDYWLSPLFWALLFWFCNLEALNVSYIPPIEQRPWGSWLAKMLCVLFFSLPIPPISAWIWQIETSRDISREHKAHERKSRWGTSEGTRSCQMRRGRNQIHMGVRRNTLCIHPIYIYNYIYII